MTERIERILNGETELFRAVIEEHSPAVRSFLAAHLGDFHAVEDIAQETFIAAYEGLHRYSPSNPMRHWLIGIARHKLNDHLKRTYRQQNIAIQTRSEILENLTTEIEDDIAQRADTFARLRGCIEKMPERARDIIQARYFSQKKLDEVAEKIGSTSLALRALLFRVRKQLRTCMQEAGS